MLVLNVWMARPPPQTSQVMFHSKIFLKIFFPFKRHHQTDSYTPDPSYMSPVSLIFHIKSTVTKLACFGRNLITPTDQLSCFWQRTLRDIAKTSALSLTLWEPSVTYTTLLCPTIIIRSFVQWECEIPTCLDLKWSKRGWFDNGLDF